MNTPEVSLMGSEMFHTGLRKGIDSKWSILAHRMVNALEGIHYVLFLDELQKAVELKGLSTDTIYDYLQRFKFPFDRKNPQRDTIEQSNFGLIMNIISKDDAEGIYEWIKYCNETGEDD